LISPVYVPSKIYRDAAGFEVFLDLFYSVISVVRD